MSYRRHTYITGRSSMGAKEMKTDKYCGIDPATLSKEILEVLEEPPWEPGHCTGRRSGVCARDYTVQEGGEAQDDL